MIRAKISDAAMLRVFLRKCLGALPRSMNAALALKTKW